MYSSYCYHMQSTETAFDVIFYKVVKDYLITSNIFTCINGTQSGSTKNLNHTSHTYACLGGDTSISQGQEPLEFQKL